MMRAMRVRVRVVVAIHVLGAMLLMGRMERGTGKGGRGKGKRGQGRGDALDQQPRDIRR